MTIDARLEELRRSFSGPIIDPAHGEYDDARRVWNAVFDKRPALVVRPLSVADIQAAVRFGRDHDLELSIRGGGHSAVGHSTSDGGLVIDLKDFNAVSVDPDHRVATCAGGALLGQLDVAAQAHGLVCPVGVVGHTGVAGLTLGGGFGRLQRRFGFTVDNVRSIELVTADGRLVRASATEEPELFWGLRGAGANFGVATSFELGLHPFDGRLHRSLRIYPADEIHELWGLFRDFSRSAPDMTTAIFVIAFAREEDDYPDAMKGRPIVLISTNHSGLAEDVERDLAPLARGPKPAVVHEGPQVYTEVQTSTDLANAWGGRTFILGGYIGDLTPAHLDAYVDHLSKVVGEGSVAITAQGGAIGRVADDAMAFHGRSAPFDISADTAWEGSELDAAAAHWTRDAMAIVQDDLLVGRYINENSDVGDVRQSYGDAKYERLRALKRAWDPDNVFRLNHNIEPA
jgi:FAD/FMN-containing dehydrogenase